MLICFICVCACIISPLQYSDFICAFLILIPTSIHVFLMNTLYAGYFCCCCFCRLLIFFKVIFFHKIILRLPSQSVWVQIRPDNYCRAWAGSKLLAKFISRRHMFAHNDAQIWNVLFYKLFFISLTYTRVNPSISLLMHIDILLMGNNSESVVLSPFSTGLLFIREEILRKALTCKT